LAVVSRIYANAHVTPLPSALVPKMTILPDEITHQAQLIYEDDHIVVVWHAGHSPELLITFGDLITLAEGRHFYGETPIRKLGLNCIGFMAKRPNWFPMSSVVESIVKLGPILESFAERITYGASMGGYAALKYSALCGATHAIALCPQWSLDEAECDGFSPGWSEWFEPSMRGMGVRPTDLSGQAYVFFDPWEARDKAHARQIGIASPSARFIWVPLVEHHVAPVMAGTAALRSLIDACRLNDAQALRRLSRHQRRANWFYQQKIAERFAASHPLAACRQILAQAAAAPQITLLPSDKLIQLAERLARLGYQDDSATCLKLAAHHVHSPLQSAMLAELAASMFGKHACLVSFLGTIPAYDSGTGQCCLTAPDQRHGFSRLHPLRLVVRGKLANLCIRTSVADIFLGLLPDGRISANADTPADFEFIALAGGRFQLRFQGKFVCADPNENLLICNRPEPSHWETFQFGAL
jgi:hypothetical protein